MATRCVFFLEAMDNAYFFIFLFYGVTYSIDIGTNNTISEYSSEYSRTYICKNSVIYMEDRKMHANRQRSDKGTHTPPVSQHMAASHPTRIPVPVASGTGAGAYQNNIETSSILSRANEVLYMQPDNFYPTQPISTRSQFDTQNGKHVTTIITGDSTISTSPSTMTNTSINYSRSRPGSGGPVYPGDHAISSGQAPAWLSQMFQHLESRLSHIDSQLSNQNSQWQNMDRTLQAQSVSLQNQDSRMLNIERQMGEINGLKNTVTRMSVRMNAIESEIQQTNITMSEYQSSIDVYSDLCDKIGRDKEASDSIVDELSRRVEKLESEYSSLESNQKKSESTLTDLQCRSMQDNLVFTGIAEVTLEKGEEYEDVQKSLLAFLEDEMEIFSSIGFHRVHRIGAYDKDTAEQNPRPIIAKF